MEKRPNFFLIGAPKCGTTSLSFWLAAHPSIFVSQIKEPSYFSTDIYTPTAPRTVKEYNRLFDGALPNHIAIGEASTSYLRSAEAVPAILRYNSNAKFLVCLRNPVDMFLSAHSQLLKSGRETEVRPEQAWQLQEARAAGKNLPTSDYDPEGLQYGRICSVGTQMERLLKMVSRERVLIILLEDMQSRPGEIYSKALRFLNVPLPQEQIEYSIHNERRSVRSLAVARVAQRLTILKRRLGLTRKFGVGHLIDRWNTYTNHQPHITNEFRTTLHDYFRADIEKLALVLNRDLGHWLRPEQ